MTTHRYRLGQVVSVSQPVPGRTRIAAVEIVKLMPASVDGELHYRVRGPDNVERAVGESQLTADAAA